MKYLDVVRDSDYVVAVNYSITLVHCSNSRLNHLETLGNIDYISMIGPLIFVIICLSDSTQ